MPKKMPDKVVWSLEDILALCGHAKREQDVAIKRAETVMDAVLMVSLARLGQQLTMIERKAFKARQGEYEGAVYPPPRSDGRT